MSDRIYTGPAISGADKYHGETATGYDDKRLKQDKWHEEQALIENMLLHWTKVPSDRYILDIPCGTGRFIRFAEDNQLHYYGLDISRDMLAQAQAKVKKPIWIRAIEHGSVLDIPYEDDNFDISLMIRLTRYLSPKERTRAMRELQRVTMHSIILTARVQDHPYAYPLDAIIADAGDGWKINREEAIASDPNYRVIELRSTDDG